MMKVKMDKCIKAALMAGILLASSSCKYMPDWVGSMESKEKLEGERVSVLAVASGIEADYDLQNVPVVVPQEKYNIRWYKSSGFHILTSDNPKAAKSFDTVKKVDSGSGASKDFHLTASPIVANNKIYTLDAKGEIIARDAKDINNKIWSYKIKLAKNHGDFLNAGITYEDNVIYATTGSNIVVAIDSESGKELWKRQINTVTRSAPSVREGFVYVNTIGNTLYALNAKDGGILWTHHGIEEDLGIAGAASPIVQSEIVYVAYSSGEIYALKAKTGEPMWSDSLALAASSSSNTLSDIDASQVIEGNKIFSVSNNGILAASELFSGIRVWEQDIASNYTPWVASGFIYLVSNVNKPQLVCIHAASGRVKWVTDLAKYKDEEDKDTEIYYSGPVMAGSRLLLVASTGKLVSFNPFNGSVISSYDIPSKIYIAPVVAYNNVYLYTNSAQLIALSGIMSDTTAEEEGYDAVESKTEASNQGSNETNSDAETSDNAEKPSKWSSPFANLKKKIFN